MPGKLGESIIAHDGMHNKDKHNNVIKKKIVIKEGDKK
mgnify:CR=1 FL=1